MRQLQVCDLWKCIRLYESSVRPQNMLLWLLKARHILQQAENCRMGSLSCAGKAKSNYVWLWQGEQQESGDCPGQPPQQNRPPSGREQSHSRTVTPCWRSLPLSNSPSTAALECLQIVMVLGLSVTSRQVPGRMPYRRCLHLWRRLCTRDPSPELGQQPQAQARDD